MQYYDVVVYAPWKEFRYEHWNNVNLLVVLGVDDNSWENANEQDVTM